MGSAVAGHLHVEHERLARLHVVDRGNADAVTHSLFLTCRDMVTASLEGATAGGRLLTSAVARLRCDLGLRTRDVPGQ